MIDEIAEFLVPAAPLLPAIPDPFDRHIAELVHPTAVADDRRARPALVGVPFDTTTMGRRGSKHAPGAVRQSMASLLAYHGGYEVDLSEAGGLSDFGDVAVVDTDVKETWRRISAVTDALARRRQPMFILGGDHGLTFPAVRGAASALPGSIALISLDAHYDVRPDHRGQPASGVPYRYALEQLDGRVDPEASSQIGIAGWENSPVAARYLRDQGVRVASSREVQRAGVGAIVAEVTERARRANAVWITCDIDAVDAAFAPGTNAPTIGGLTSHQFLEFVWEFSQLLGVVGVDVVEVSPPLDSGGITTLLGAHVLLTALAGLHAAAR